MSCSIGYAKKPCYENIKMESLFNECGQKLGFQMFVYLDKSKN